MKGNLFIVAKILKYMIEISNTTLHLLINANCFIFIEQLKN